MYKDWTHLHLEVLNEGFCKELNEDIPASLQSLHSSEEGDVHMGHGIQPLLR